MKPVSSDNFLTWAGGVGIGFDERYPDAQWLDFVPPRNVARFWTLRSDPANWTYFTATLLDGLDPWSKGYLWPRGGNWPAASPPLVFNEGIRDIILRGLGVPSGWSGAICFALDEYTPLLAIIFVYLAFGWCVGGDLFFIPDHGRQIIQTDHHDVIHFRCTQESRVQRMVAHMAEAGYQLPTELPDETFIRPYWMPEQNTDQAENE